MILKKPLMKKQIIVTLLLMGCVFASPAFAAKAQISKSQLKECIHYYDEIEKKKGNIERLGDVMDESGREIDSYDYELDRIEQQLSHTIGYKRNALIQEYNSLMDSREKFYHVNTLAADKREKRIREARSLTTKFNDQCVNVIVSRTDLDELCDGNRGFCSSFD